MLVFSLKDYRNRLKNAKEKVFIEFLYEKFGGQPNDCEEFDNEYFTLIDEDHLIESFKYYIAKNHVTSKTTAENYITFLTNFFKMLSTDYNIKNDIFVNMELNKSFVVKTKEIISTLNETKSKDVATNEQYEELNYYIEIFLKTLQIYKIYDEIDKVKDSAYANKKIHYKLYNRFVSSIAIKLVMKYALANRIVASLDLDSLDLVNEILHVNGFELPLDTELIDLLKKYIEIRAYVLKVLSIQQNRLFIKPDGQPYISISRNDEYVDCTRLFKIMNDCLHTVAADLFASKRILEMLDKRIDMSIVVELSGKNKDKCYELMSSNLSEGTDKLQKFLKEETEIIPKIISVKEKGYINIKCPFCGKEKKAISDEWILVQFKEDGEKNIACRGCKGNNGKYRI